MNCGNCGAVMRYRREEAVYDCEFCHAIALPALEEEQILLLEPAPTFLCPACHLPLHHARFHGASSLCCPACRGMLLDQETFLQLVEWLRSQARGPGILPPKEQTDLERSHLNCPLCGAAMDNHPYQGPGRIQVDTCFPCRRIWLDGGEFNRVIDAPGRDRQG